MLKQINARALITDTLTCLDTPVECVYAYGGPCLRVSVAGAMVWITLAEIQALFDAYQPPKLPQN